MSDKITADLTMGGPDDDGSGEDGIVSPNTGRVS